MSRLGLSVTDNNPLSINNQLSLIDGRIQKLSNTGTLPIGSLDQSALTSTLPFTVKDDLFAIVDDNDVTKLAKFELSGLTTGTTRTYTLQDSSDTLVGRATTDTLTNKTLWAVDGTAAAPSISFGNATAAGLFKAGTNILGFSTAGTERARIDASGKFGIGGAAATHPLEVFGGVGFVIQYSDGTVKNGLGTLTGVGFLGTLTNHPLSLNTNGTERMRIDSSGNVGIGTTNQFGSGVLVIGIANATTAPTTNPTGGGVLYCSAGALKYRGSSGTVTTIAVA